MKATEILYSISLTKINITIKFILDIKFLKTQFK